MATLLCCLWVLCGHHIVLCTQTQYFPTLFYQCVLRFSAMLIWQDHLRINQKNHRACCVSYYPQSFVASTKSSSQTLRFSLPDTPLKLSIWLCSSLYSRVVELSCSGVSKCVTPRSHFDRLIHCSLTFRLQCLASLPVHDYQHPLSACLDEVLNVRLSLLICASNLSCSLLESIRNCLRVSSTLSHSCVLASCCSLISALFNSKLFMRLISVTPFSV